MMLSRFHYGLMAAALMLLIFGFLHHDTSIIQKVSEPWKNDKSGDSKEPASKPVSFYDVGKKAGTDKVSPHQYWFMYDKYLGPIREQRLKFLEIGLGCNMNYGPGKSLAAWREYLPNIDLYFIEYDAACAEKWKDKVEGVTIFAGDQADRKFLQEFVDKTGGDFDIIIDDGGHSMVQQKTSIEMLWQAIKPGGIYFCEDLQTSYMKSYGGDAQQGNDPNAKTMMKFVYELMDDKMVDGKKHAISADMRSIDCMREVCAFTKKEVGTI